MILSDNRFYCKNKDTYPPFKNGFYLEEYFLDKINSENPLLKRKYIPVLWTNFQIESWFNFFKNDMQRSLDEWVKNNPSDNGYFTIVQYDDGPLLNLPNNTLVFGACSGDIPIPLIYEDKNKTLEMIEKKPYSNKNILCSFVGSLTANNIQPHVRESIYNHFKNNANFYFNITNWTADVDKNKQDNFIDVTSRSKFIFAPRGYGRSSFRFWEALQLGSIPIYVYNDNEWLPYKDILDYSKFCISIHISDIHLLEEKLKNITEIQYNNMINEYNKIKDFFSLEGMYNYIINYVN
jgi:hypothetical protein